MEGWKTVSILDQYWNKFNSFLLEVLRKNNIKGLNNNQSTSNT